MNDDAVTLRRIAELERLVGMLISAAVPDQNTSTTSDPTFSSINLDAATGNTDGQLRISRAGASQPAIILGRTAEAADEKFWRIVEVGNALRVTTLSDDVATQTVALEFVRGAGIALGVTNLNTQLDLTVAGSGGGVLIGGDALLYRSAADVLRTPDSLTVDVGLNVGSASGAAAGTIRAQGAEYLGNQTNASITQVDINALADNGVAQIDTGASGTISLAFIINSSDGTFAIYTLQGGVHATQEIADPSGLYTITATTASRTNIYWSAGNTRYELENKLGGTKNFRVLLFKNG